MSSAPPKAASPELDADSRRWLRELRADGAAKERALADLHALLLRATRFEVARRRPLLPHVRGDDLDDLAVQAADDALMSVLRRLDDFRGVSRFTTWAYKFGLLEAAVKLRKRAWQGKEIPLADEAWSAFSDASAQPDLEAEQGELLATVRQAIDEILTDHQRRVLVALAIDGVPIDVLAEQLGSTRGALYKTLHDARRKLRAELEACGLAPDTFLQETT
jgi:RNA polymerase sigma-70 factor (ECF subfamily)